MATPITDAVLRMLDPYAIACRMCSEGQYAAGSRRMAEIIDDIRKLLAPVEGARADLVIETCDQGHKYGKLSDASHGCPHCLREGLDEARGELAP